MSSPSSGGHLRPVLEPASSPFTETPSSRKLSALPAEDSVSQPPAPPSENTRTTLLTGFPLPRCHHRPGNLACGPAPTYNCCYTSSPPPPLYLLPLPPPRPGTLPAVSTLLRPFSRLLCLSLSPCTRPAVRAQTHLSVCPSSPEPPPHPTCRPVFTTPSPASSLTC